MKTHKKSDGKEKQVYLRMGIENNNQFEICSSGETIDVKSIIERLFPSIEKVIFIIFLHLILSERNILLLVQLNAFQIFSLMQFIYSSYDHIILPRSILDGLQVASIKQ